MSTAATEAEILAGVERWARARGFWWAANAPQPWNVAVASDGGFDIWQPSDPPAHVRPAHALAWALTVETDPEPVDVGRCPACADNEYRLETESVGVDGVTKAHAWANAKRDKGWNVQVLREDAGRYRLACARPCTACSGTGRETVPLARLLLDAATDATARERALVHADHLQAAGHPLGEVLAFAVGLWRERTLSDYDGVSPDDDADAHLAGTAETLRWLEWLTWAREFGKAHAHHRVAQQAAALNLFARPPAPPVDPEARALSETSTISYDEARYLIRAASAAGANRDDRARLGVRGMQALVATYRL